MTIDSERLYLYTQMTAESRLSLSLIRHPPFASQLSNTNPDT